MVLDYHYECFASSSNPFYSERFVFPKEVEADQFRSLRAMMSASCAQTNNREAGMSAEIVFSTAVELAGRIARKELSAREVMQAHLDQIERVNPTINAIVAMLDPEDALTLADAADARQAAGEPLGVLHGLPTAFKDLVNATGFPTSQGSPIFAGTYPLQDDLIVERIRKAGAIGIGKTNVPEFGLGSHSFNPVYGVTRNPYDQRKTAGGSSGGAGAALATGMLPIADGSDMGGSLRNPGNFNNVVGFRNSAGLVPRWPNGMPWLPLSVKGALGRTVGDIALQLQAIAGYDRRDQASSFVDPASFARPLDRDFRGVKVAFSPDLGALPIDRGVRGVIEASRPVFEDLGLSVSDAAPNLSAADRIFLDLRAFSLASGMGELLKTHRDQIKPEAIWNIEEGLKLSAVDVGQALIKQSQLFQQVHEFMEEHEFLITVVNQVPPFDHDIRYPTEIDGVQLDTYLDWMRSAYWITATAHPAISVPGGFTPEGLPVGIQIVGRHGADFEVLQLAHAFEAATPHWKTRPTVAG
jgi:amidase